MVREFELIAAIRPYLDGDSDDVPVGTDDDAAVLDLAGSRIAVAVDTLVDAVHFDRSISALDDVGWKALAVNVSDLVAIGATPSAAVVSLMRPDTFSRDDAVTLYRGMRAGADRWGCRLVGGDTVGGPALAVSVTVLGPLVDAGRPLRRGGAGVGDAVVVVGRLGLAAAGLGLARAGARDLLDAHPDLLAAHRRPEPLLHAVGGLVVGGVTSAIDVSDGLGRDLAHVARASGVAIRLDAERLPRHPGVVAAAARLECDPLDLVLGGGDDYAIAATVPPSGLHRFEAAMEASGVRARVIGEVEAGSGDVRLVGADGTARDVRASGWEHA